MTKVCLFSMASSSLLKAELCEADAPTLDTAFAHCISNSASFSVSAWVLQSQWFVKMLGSGVVEAILVILRNKGMPGADVWKSLEAILLNFSLVCLFSVLTSTLFINVSRKRKAVAPILMVFSRGYRSRSINRFD